MGGFVHMGGFQSLGASDFNTAAAFDEYSQTGSLGGFSSQYSSQMAYANMAASNSGGGVAASAAGDSYRDDYGNDPNAWLSGGPTALPLPTSGSLFDLDPSVTAGLDPAGADPYNGITALPLDTFDNAVLMAYLNNESPVADYQATLSYNVVPFDPGGTLEGQAPSLEEPGDWWIGGWDVNHPSVEVCGKVKTWTLATGAVGLAALSIGVLFPPAAPIADLIAVPALVNTTVFGIYYLGFCGP